MWYNGHLWDVYVCATLVCIAVGKATKGNYYV